MSESWQDRILDTFLEEIISGQSPPDLTDRIVAKYHQQADSLALPELPDNSDKDRSWWQDFVDAPPVQATADSVELKETFDRTLDKDYQQYLRESHSAKKRLQIASLLVGIAVCLLAVATLTFTLPLMQGTPQQFAKPTVSQPSDLNQNAVAENVTPPAVNPPAPALPPSPERLDISGLPFAVIEPDSMPVDQNSSASSPTEAAKSDQEIIAQINSTFEKLWSEFSVPAAEPLNDEQWLHRAASVLLGATPTPTQIELFTSTEDADKRDYLLQQATQSERFSRRLARQIALNLAGPARKESAALRTEFEAWLTENFAQRVAFNDTVYQLLTASTVRPDATVAQKPESYWLTSLQDGEGHRAAERIGSIWLNQSLHCSKCHDQNTDPATSQDAYWSLVASLNLNGTKELFYDKADGRLSSAVARLPDGTSLQDVPAELRREKFAQWLTNNPAMAEGTVNLAWKIVFGAPLISVDTAAKDNGLESRKELLKSLAQQFRVHRYDLPRLVRWLASSHPFASPARSITQQQWLLASEKELRDLRVAENLFASYRDPNLSNMSSQQLLSQVVQIEKEQAGSQLRRTVLAQPMPTQSLPAANNSATDAPLPAWLQELRIHASVDSDSSHGQHIKKLLSTKLSWKELVHHALGRAPSSEELKLSEELLQYHRGNKEATLLQIHWTAHQGQVL
ncbi:MAG: hypothetical protein RLY14_1610 [Planctomycetota bacterium]